MSRGRSELPGFDRHAHFAPEDLVEIALEQRTGRVQTDARSARAHARARACPQCSLALDGLLADLQQVRDAVASLPSKDARRTATLAEATLGMTTRKVSTWHRDWRMIGRFLREGWSESLAVRCLAVSLLLHLIALPILAIVLALQVRKAEPALAASDPAATRITIEPVREPELPRPLADPSEVSTRSIRLAQARHDLLEAGASKLSAFERQIGCSDGLAGSVARTLLAHSQRLGIKSFDSIVPEPAADSALFERAQCAELLLDDWASSGRVDRNLSAALWQLPKQGDLVIRSLRAEPALPRHGGERARSDARELAGVTGDPAPRPAVTPELFDALEQACASRLAVEPSGYLADWVAWGRGRAH